MYNMFNMFNTGVCENYRNSLVPKLCLYGRSTVGNRWELTKQVIPVNPWFNMFKAAKCIL